MLIKFLYFLGGVGFTFLMIGIFIYFVFKKERAELNKMNSPINSSEKLDDEIKEIVLQYKKEYLKLNTFGFQQNSDKLKKLSYSMAKDIGKKYYPDSKYPELELEFYQLLKLNHTMTNYLLESLEGTKFDMIKYAKISTLMGINDNRLRVVDGFKKISLVNSIIKSPISMVLGKVGVEVGLTVGLEIFFKGVGKYGVEKLGRELNRLYSKHYIEKSEKKS